MPEYLAPGVYVEETSFRSKSIEGVGTSTCAFVGLTGRGPVSSDDTQPPLLTSFTDYELYYGGVDDLLLNGKATINYLAHAARAFFSNGGGRLYVSRVADANAAAAVSPQVNDPTAAATNKQVNFIARTAGGARIPGTTANYRVRVVQTQTPTSKLVATKLTAGSMVRLKTDAYVMGPTVTTSAANISAFTALADTDTVWIINTTVEVTDPSGAVTDYIGLGLDPQHPRFIGVVLGAIPPVASDALINPVRINIGGAVNSFELRTALFGALVEPNPATAQPPAVEKTALLVNGSDGNGPPDGKTYQDALDRLLALEDISIVAAPGASSFADPTPDNVNQLLIGHAEARRSYRIAVLDPPPGLDPQGVRALKGKLDSKYAALYYPWIVVANPLATPSDPNQTSELLLPPSGFVTGIYARSDVQRGVWKAPANETVTGALRLQREVRFGEQELLNPLGVNCIRTLPNRGIRVWGARTTSSDPEWKYVPVRRYFLYLESSIDRGTQWAVFEPNGERLWANITTTITDFLYNEWLSGALLGATPKEAFFVRCDRSTMSQNDLDNGRLICLVGVAALKPAEFVIFRIGQKTADARD